jgi:hypothetical protein
VPLYYFPYILERWLIFVPQVFPKFLSVSGTHIISFRKLSYRCHGTYVFSL